MSDTKANYKIPSLPTEARVRDLLARMSLEEKIAQLYEIWDPTHSREGTKDFIRRFGVGSRILAGSHLSGEGQAGSQSAAEINSWQRIAVEEHHLGIPILFGRDVIHGFRTVFPIPLGLAASFSPAQTEKAYRTAAREAASAGVNWAFAPMLDIARDPRWGRISEGYGEDPWLCAKLAAAAVTGFQGSTPEEHRSPEHLLACAKHYIGYGAAMGGRDYDTAEISDNTLRNIYLPPFIAAVNAGLGSVMSGFHDLNGESVSGSHYLLSDLLRDELGFKGIVISDWASVRELVHHRVAEDDAAAARLALLSGVDMEMVSDCYIRSLAGLVQTGEVPLERIEEAVRRILTIKFDFGLFEHPYVDESLAVSVQYSPENQETARAAALGSIILLKNSENLLPLSPERRNIAFLGPMLEETTNLWGSWAPDGLPSDMVSLRDKLTERYPLVHAPFRSPAMADEALLSAMRADLVVFVAGEAASRSGENNNVSDISLPPGQSELLAKIYALGKPVVLIVIAGRPLNLSADLRNADAVLYAFHPGSKGPDAILEVLFGQANPGGRLPVSLPRDNNQIPVHYNFKSTGKAFDSAGKPVDDRYRAVDRYQDQLTAPLFPFGYGLSYTTFSYRDIRISSAVVRESESVTVSARVQNTGTRDGEEVVQCYVQDCVASLTRPMRELRGFERIHLAPGEEKEVKFSLGAAELGFFNHAGNWVVEPGLFKVWIGPNCYADLETSFSLTAE